MQSLRLKFVKGIVEIVYRYIATFFNFEGNFLLPIIEKLLSLRVILIPFKPIGDRLTGIQVINNTTDSDIEIHFLVNVFGG